MVEFLDYIFDRIPLLDENKLKHIAIARYVFNNKFRGNL
jgi:hypothetical protein